MTKYEITYFNNGVIEEVDGTYDSDEAREMIVVGMNVGMVDAIQLSVTDTNAGDVIYTSEVFRTCSALNSWMTVINTGHMMMLDPATL